MKFSKRSQSLFIFLQSDFSQIKVKSSQVCTEHSAILSAVLSILRQLWPMTFANFSSVPPPFIISGDLPETNCSHDIARHVHERV